jgi:hypothetical protein
VGEKKQIRTPKIGGRHPKRPIFDFRRRAEKERASERRAHASVSFRVETHLHRTNSRANVLLHLRVWISRRGSTKFSSFCALFVPLSRNISLSHRLRKLSPFPREKNKKIAKLHAPLLEEPNMVRAFALVDVEHKKLMVLI